MTYVSLIIAVDNRSIPLQSTVAFQGETGAYSELAILDNFENGITKPKNSFKDIFVALDDKLVTYGMIPVRNSVAGEVVGISDLLDHYNPQIVNEIPIAIEHCLIVNSGIKEIKSVYSHIQALKQCHQYLESNALEQIPYYDTAGAVKLIKEQRLYDAAAIASKLAADIYDMDILDSNLGSEGNITTFYLIQLPK